MNLQEAIKIIQDTITEKNKEGDNWYSLAFDSQPQLQDDGSYKEWYRADCLYMVTGDFKYSIDEALIALAKRLKP